MLSFIVVMRVAYCGWKRRCAGVFFFIVYVSNVFALSLDIGLRIPSTSHTRHILLPVQIQDLNFHSHMWWCCCVQWFEERGQG